MSYVNSTVSDWKSFKPFNLLAPACKNSFGPFSLNLAMTNRQYKYAGDLVEKESVFGGKEVVPVGWYHTGTQGRRQKNAAQANISSTRAINLKTILNLKPEPPL